MGDVHEEVWSKSWIIKAVQRKTASFTKYLLPSEIVGRCKK